jgi:hypothetical protein
MQTTESSVPAEISRVAVRLPPLWAKRPAVWFAQAEVHFTLAGINSERTKFYYVISQLDNRYATEVEDIITSPTEKDPYATLKAELVTHLSPSREQRIHRLLTLEEIGDRKLSQFLRHLRSLAPDAPDDFLSSIWSSRLPTNVQAILAGQHEDSLDATARSADRILQVASHSALASVGSNPPPKRGVLLQQIEDFSHQVAALSTELTHLRDSSKDPRTSSRTRRSGNRSPSRNDSTPNTCWYHRGFGPERKSVPLPATTASRKT